MVDVGQLFGVFGSFATSLFRIRILDVSILNWYMLFWALAIVGWALQILYGRGDK